MGVGNGCKWGAGWPVNVNQGFKAFLFSFSCAFAFVFFLLLISKYVLGELSSCKTGTGWPVKVEGVQEGLFSFSILLPLFCFVFFLFRNKCHLLCFVFF